MFKRSVLVIGGVLLVLAVLAGLKYRQISEGMARFSNFTPPPATVSAITATTERWRPQIATVGTLTAIAGTELSTEVAGIVTKMPFNSGEKVEKGTVLLQLDDSVEQANLTSLLAQESLAQIKHDRIKVLFERRNVSATEFDESSANLKVAQAAVAQTRANIAKKTLVAPFSGQLGIRQVDLGQYLKAGDTIVSLQDLSSLYADFSVPEQHLPALYVGQEVIFHNSAYPGVAFTGKVAALEAKVDENTRNIAIRAEVPNADGRLRPGMYAEIRLLMRDTIEPVVLPSTAITYSPFGDAVFVVQEDEAGQLRAYRRYVELGEQRGDGVAILSGVEAGEQVISAGTLKLDHEAPVQLAAETQG
ncbi:efflux RND transporter periplasmic adaptor subunit [Ferrimonas gelatinilytica]|uniref:Multidrug efflux RND transporter periplasmic adaptor subunit MexV n=1 Tax=Ferrimonas gelatinilytica TaxID=1255257 RepID=A0ABP9RVQ8_9GAMM